MGKIDPRVLAAKYPIIAPPILSRIADLPLADDLLEMKRLAQLDVRGQAIVAAIIGGGEAEGVAGAMRSYEDAYAEARERDPEFEVRHLPSWMKENPEP